MPEFLYQWLRLIVYYLNLLFGNIGFVRVLKRFVSKIEQPSIFYYLFPTIIAFAFAFVVVFVVLTRLLTNKNKEVKWVKK